MIEETILNTLPVVVIAAIIIGALMFVIRIGESEEDSTLDEYDNEELDDEELDDEYEEPRKSKVVRKI